MHGGERQKDRGRNDIFYGNTIQRANWHFHVRPPFAITSASFQYEYSLYCHLKFSFILPLFLTFAFGVIHRYLSTGL